MGGLVHLQFIEYIFLGQPRELRNCINIHLIINFIPFFPFRLHKIRGLHLQKICVYIELSRILLV